MKGDMADDLDVDAMLEAPFQKEEESSAPPRNSSVTSDKENGHSKDKGDEEIKEKDKKRSRSRSREKKRHRSSSRDRDRKRSRSRDKDRKRSRSRDRRRSRSRDRAVRDRRRSRDRSRDRRERRRSVERKRRSRSRSRDKRRSVSRTRDRKRSRSRSRDRRRSSRSRSRDRRRRRSRSRDRRRSRSRSRDRRRHRSKSRHRTRSRSASKGKRELTAEERDARTVFCMQLSARIKARELEDFFSVVGKVTDVRIITDAKTRRSKGIAYVEFEDVESVPLALGLGSQKLLGVPIVVQPTLAERNRAANVTSPDEGSSSKSATGPMRLYVGSLHFNITEDMLRSIFEPFGKIDMIQLIMDTESGRSKGYGFVTFHSCDDAKKALEQLNGFQLAGRPMKVNHVTDKNDASQANSLLDSDEKERTGVELDATARLSLMAKLAEGTDLQLPPAAVTALNTPALPQPVQPATPAIATQCFLLSNMFDPSAEQDQTWADEIRDDVIQECNKHGGVLHVFVDKQSAQGNVYVKCPSIATAVASVNALHGRWFAGKMITAAYVPVMSYHSLFPDAMPQAASMPMSNL